MDDGQIRGAENTERGAELSLAFTIARERAQDGVSHVNEHAEEQCREPRVPRPVIAPGLCCPEWPRREHDRAEHDRELGAGSSDRVPRVTGLHEVADGTDEARGR